MHRNLRLFYFLILATVIALGLRQYSNFQSAEIHSLDAAAFAVTDTASIDRIFIADKDGRQALLERVPDGRYWRLNGKHFARKDAVDLLLKTFKRTAVQRPVTKGELATVNRMLAGRGKKVEIYQGGEKPVKVWYIGTSTQSHTGTFMVVGDADGHIAEEPFVVHMEGFTGFLSTRFFTDEREWRYTGVFDYPGKSLRRVEVEHHEHPSRSYVMEVDSIGSLTVDLALGWSTMVDTLAWHDRFVKFRKTHLETFNNHLSEKALDSLKKAAPAFTLRAYGWERPRPIQSNCFGRCPPWTPMMTRVC